MLVTKVTIIRRTRCRLMSRTAREFVSAPAPPCAARLEAMRLCHCALLSSSLREDRDGPPAARATLDALWAAPAELWLVPGPDGSASADIHSAALRLSCRAAAPMPWGGGAAGPA